MFRKRQKRTYCRMRCQRMIEAIDNIASGDFNEIDATDFNNLVV